MAKHVDAVMAKVNKKYGEGTLIRASRAKGLRVSRFSTGSAVLDSALGGGWAEGRWNEIVGAFSAFKTTLVFVAVANWQAKHKKGKVLFVDAESPSFDANWAETCGVDLERMELCQTESGEEAGDVIFEWLESADGELLIVIDSIAALMPLKEIENDMDGKAPASHARLIAKLVRRSKSQMKTDFLTNSPKKTFLVLNQRRAKFNSMPWADNEMTTGGHTLEHAIDIRVKFRRGEPISKETTTLGVKLKKTYGYKVNFQVQKNKTGMTLFDKGMFTFYTRKYEGRRIGIPNAEDVLPLAVAYGAVKVKGDNFKMNGEDYRVEDLNSDRWLISEVVKNIVKEEDDGETSSAKKPKLAL